MSRVTCLMHGNQELFAQRYEFQKAYAQSAQCP